MVKSSILSPYYKNDSIEAGCDEAGRGALAGPVYAAAVILPQDFFHPLLNDSKKLTHRQRGILRPIIEKSAVAWSVCSVDAREIDKINILKASILAMHLALDGLKIEPQFIIVDGNRFINYRAIPHKCIIKGDSLYASIAAASVLAKTYRDEYMLEISKEYPGYGWEKNMAYPTKLHRDAIKMLGATPYHRLSYNLGGDATLF